MGDRLLTIDNLVERSGFSKSYFHNRKKTGAKTLKLVSAHPLKTTEEFYQEWIEGLGEQQRLKVVQRNGPLKLITKMQQDLDTLGSIIGFDDHIAMIQDSLQYLGEMNEGGNHGTELRC